MVNAQSAQDCTKEHGAQDEAVALAQRAVGSAGAVLLSPGCSSFDWYGSYVERGLDFVRIVHGLLDSGPRSGE